MCAPLSTSTFTFRLKCKTEIYAVAPVKEKRVLEPTSFEAGLSGTAGCHRLLAFCVEIVVAVVVRSWAAVVARHEARAVDTVARCRPCRMRSGSMIGTRDWRVTQANIHYHQHRQYCCARMHSQCLQRTSTVAQLPNGLKVEFLEILYNATRERSDDVAG